MTDTPSPIIILIVPTIRSLNKEQLRKILSAIHEIDYADSSEYELKVALQLDLKAGHITEEIIHDMVEDFSYHPLIVCDS